MTATARIGVAMIGHAFMGAAHSQAWRVAPRFFDLVREPDMTVLCGRDPGRSSAAAQRLGWRESTADWRSLLDRDDVQVIDICTPGDSHAEIAVAALQAGKHVLCEKPLANNVEEAQTMADAAAAASPLGVRAMVGFTYRRVPAVELARRLVAGGRIGEIRHVRAQYLQDWLSDPEVPLSWRLDRDRAGSGALGDIGAHVIDLAQHITGHSIERVTGHLETFVEERPRSRPPTIHSRGGSPRGAVTVDDAAVFLTQFEGGAVGVFEATRFASGRKNALRIEINGSAGSLAFDVEELNVLQFHDATESGEVAGFRRILVTEPSHPYVASWWPPGHGLGYEHGFTHQAVDLLRSIEAGEDPAPGFGEGLRVQRVIAAVERSARSRAWEVIAEDASPESRHKELA